MKKLLKYSGYILATVMVLIISQFSALAADDSANKGSSLSGLQIFGGFALLVLVIVLPLMRKENKKEIL